MRDVPLPPTLTAPSASPRRGRPRPSPQPVYATAKVRTHFGPAIAGRQTYALTGVQILCSTQTRVIPI
jgi:hypothetical protein